MTQRPTAPPDSDLLVQGVVNVLKNEEFIPRGGGNKLWPFAKLSKVQRDYERVVQEVTAKRRAAREAAVEDELKSERGEADAALERARASSQAAHRAKIGEARKPYEETEAKARAERDAAIAAANLAYQQAIVAANSVYEQEAAALDRKRDALMLEATAKHAEACAAIEAKRKAELQRITHELKLIPLEGPMRIIEDTKAFSIAERRKSLIGLVDMAGREDLDDETAELCLRKVAEHVTQESSAESPTRLLDVGLLEALVELARRTPARRPTIVHCLHAIVANNPGHSSPAFIKGLTELYVLASSDVMTSYSANPVENEKVFDAMREHIADTLKVTPRRSLVPPAGPGSAPPAQLKKRDAEITADVDIRELIPLEAGSTPADGAGMEAIVEAPSGPPSVTRPPPMPSARRPKRAPAPEN